MLGEWLTDRLILWECCEFLSACAMFDSDHASNAEKFCEAFRGEADTDTLEWCLTFCVTMASMAECDLKRDSWKARSRVVGRLLEYQVREWQ